MTSAIYDFDAIGAANKADTAERLATPEEAAAIEFEPISGLPSAATEWRERMQNLPTNLAVAALFLRLSKPEFVKTCAELFDSGADCYVAEIFRCVHSALEDCRAYVQILNTASARFISASAASALERANSAQAQP